MSFVPLYQVDVSVLTSNKGLFVFGCVRVVNAGTNKAA